MTDRFNSFIVVLDRDLREDDAAATIAALEQIKGVIKVTPNVVDMESIVAESRVRNELGRKLWEILYPPKT
jgi:hypothetical protein